MALPVFSLLALGSLLQPSLGAITSTLDDAPPTGRGVVLSLSLDKPIVTAGEEVTMHEIIPASSPVNGRDLVGGEYDVLRIGEYDKRADRFSLFDVDDFELLLNWPYAFEPLSPGWFSSPHVYFKIDNCRNKGIIRKFKPTKTGVFLVYSAWHLKKGGKITGPPIVLSVRPKPPKKEANK